MNKDNPNFSLPLSLAMLKDDEAVAAINKKVGDYDWFIADELVEVYISLKLIKKNPLNNI